MKKLILVVLATILIVGCRENGTPVKTTDSEYNFNVVKLFEIDGVSVYRFYDGGKYVYFTNSNGKVPVSYTHLRIYKQTYTLLAYAIRRTTSRT